MIIGQPRIEVSDDARLVFPISSDRGTPDELWFSVAPEFAPMLSERADAAVIGLLNCGMRSGEELVVRGSTTDTLLASAAEEIQDLMLRISPTWQRVAVIGDLVTVADARAPGIALAFSGGVDSFASLEARVLHPPYPSLRATHLIYTNVGSHDPGGHRLFRDRFERLAPIADRIEVPFIAIDSNLSEFYWDRSWEATHVMRNVAAGMALQAGLGRLLHSATYDWSYLRVVPDPVQSRVEAILGPMLSTNAFTVASVYGGRQRMDKMRAIATEPLAYEFLDVCTDPHQAGNCARCVKCQRALLALELLGVQDRFGGIFDLQQYRRGRADFIDYVWASPSTLDNELRVLLEANGIRPRQQSLAGKAIAHATRIARGLSGN